MARFPPPGVLHSFFFPSSLPSFPSSQSSRSPSLQSFFSLLLRVKFCRVAFRSFEKSFFTSVILYAAWKLVFSCHSFDSRLYSPGYECESSVHSFFFTAFQNTCDPWERGLSNYSSLVILHKQGDRKEKYQEPTTCLNLLFT